MIHRRCFARLSLSTLLLLALTTAGLVAGCGGGGANAGPTVVATTTMLGDAARTLLQGTGIKVVTLIQPGIDPHTYELKASDAKQLQAADFVIYNGLGLEGKLGQALEVLPAKVEAGALVPEDLRIGAEQFEGAYDPHVWMDVGLWAEHVTGGLAEQLAEQFPEHADRIRVNASTYQRQLIELDGYTRQVIGLIPAEHRFLVTAHDAFSYFSRAYDIPVRAVQGISTVSEAGVADMERLTTFIVENNVPAVFIETSVSTKPIDKLVEGVEARGKTVRLAPAIFSDSTGPAGTFEGTYLGMLDHNATVIARELGAPGVDSHGYFGKLTLGHDHVHEEEHAGHDDHDDHDHG